MQFPDSEILVMARAPEAGRAKTRLIPALGEEGAAMLHGFLLEHLLGKLSQAVIAPLTLCCTPDTEHPFFLHCRDRYGVRLQQQYGDGLGERLHNALSTSLESSKHVVVIGCDIPQLVADDLIAAFEALERGIQSVISPTEDGGYALLGIAEPAARLFSDIDWGSEQVMVQTRQQLSAMDWSWSELKQQWDVDRPEDLQRLVSLELSPKIKELLSTKC
ncbi:MAG: TIGR04282 family arsenosugar biosynthesis glycosyltransferase [Pseudomonadota bacterium]